MKKMILVSSFADVVPQFKEFINENLAKKTITFIPTASLTEEDPFYVEAAKNELESLGLIVDCLELSTATGEEITTKITHNDYIYVSGGNTFFLLQHLKQSGADQLIIEQVISGKVYIGESAGAIVTTPTISYITTMDDPVQANNLSDYTGLNLVDSYPVPHYGNFPFVETIQKIVENYQATLPLIPISNTQAIVVSNDLITVK